MAELLVPCLTLLGKYVLLCDDAHKTKVRGWTLDLKLTDGDTRMLSTTLQASNTDKRSKFVAEASKKSRTKKAQVEQALEDLLAQVEQALQPKAPQTLSDDPAHFLEQLGKALLLGKSTQYTGLRLQEIWCSDKETYQLVVNDGTGEMIEVLLGTCSALMNQTAVCKAVCDKLHVPLERIWQKDQWASIAEQIMRVAKARDTGAGTRNNTEAWLLDYLGDEWVQRAGDYDDVVNGLSFARQGYVWIYLDNFLRHIRAGYRRDLERDALIFHLKAIGFEPWQANAEQKPGAHTDRGRQKTTCFWRRPILGSPQDPNTVHTEEETDHDGN